MKVIKVFSLIMFFVLHYHVLASAFSLSNDSKPQLVSEVQSLPTDNNKISKNSAYSQTADNIDVIIPGIGRIGSIPKLDFGLELLYGVNKQIDEKNEFRGDDIIFRGEVKQKF